MVKLHGVVGSLRLSCGDCPNLVCKGPVAASKGTNSGITAFRIVWGREENTVALVASWGALCLQPLQRRRTSPQKEGTSVTHPRLHRLHPWLYRTFTYASLLVLLPLLACALVIVASYRLLT